MVYESFLIAAAALKTPTRNGYNAQGVNLTFCFLWLSSDFRFRFVTGGGVQVLHRPSRAASDFGAAYIYFNLSP